MIDRGVSRSPAAQVRRGAVGVALLGAAAVGIGGAALLAQSKWRIEQTSDALTCGLQSTAYFKAGKVLADALATEAEACMQLASIPGDQCPSIALPSLTRCNELMGEGALPGLHRVLVYPSLAQQRIDDVGTAAGARAWFNTQMYDLFGHFGAGCPTPVEHAYLVADSSCLASKVKVDEIRSVLVTAAHCLQGATTINMQAPNSPAPKVEVKNCAVPDDFDYSKWEKNCKKASVEGVCKLDIAFCALPSKLQDPVPEMTAYVEKQKPSTGKMQVQSRHDGLGCSFKLDKLDLMSIEWPQPEPPTFMKAGAATDVGLDPGDSGAPLFLQTGTTRQLVGVNVRTSESTKPLKAVALYLHYDALIAKLLWE